MFERLEALEAAVRQIAAWLRAGPEQDGHKFGDPPAPMPPAAEDPDKAKAAYEAAQAEVKAQQERAKLNVEAAQANERRAKEVLDKSTAEAKAQEQAAAQAARQTQQQEQPAERRR